MSVNFEQIVWFENPLDLAQLDKYFLSLIVKTETS